MSALSFVYVEEKKKLPLYPHYDNTAFIRKKKICRSQLSVSTCLYSNSGRSNSTNENGIDNCVDGGGRCRVQAGVRSLLSFTFMLN